MLNNDNMKLEQQLLEIQQNAGSLQSKFVQFQEEQASSIKSMFDSMQQHTAIINDGADADEEDNGGGQGGNEVEHQGYHQKEINSKKYEFNELLDVKECDNILQLQDDLYIQDEDELFMQEQEPKVTSIDVRSMLYGHGMKPSKQQRGYHKKTQVQALIEEDEDAFDEADQDFQTLIEGRHKAIQLSKSKEEEKNQGSHSESRSLKPS